MSDNRYNGWTNRQTWLAHLWLTSDEGSYHYWAQRADALDAGALAEELKKAHEEDAVEVSGGWRGDVLMSFVAETDWSEIAEALKEE